MESSKLQYLMSEVWTSVNSSVYESSSSSPSSTSRSVPVRNSDIAEFLRFLYVWYSVIGFFSLWVMRGIIMCFHRCFLARQRGCRVGTSLSVASGWTDLSGNEFDKPVQIHSK